MFAFGTDCDCDWIKRGQLHPFLNKPQELRVKRRRIDIILNDFFIETNSMQENITEDSHTYSEHIGK